MDRLSALDAAFLEAEDADRNVSMAIASVGVFDGTPPTRQELASAYAGKLPLVPRYRQRVWRAPFDIAAPVWVDDPHFDISSHLYRVAAPRPGGDAELSAVLARVMSERLERDRPLWETWIVEGLAGGRWALISKVHHCMVDGVAGTELYHLLLSPTPQWDPEPSVDDAVVEPVSRLRLLAAAAAQASLTPLRQMQVAAQSVRHPRVAAEVVRSTARGVVAMAHVFAPTPASSLTGPICRERRYAATVVPLADLKDISRRLGVTVNDVALAAAAGGFRALLLTRNEPCRPDAVRSLVPVSVRPVGHEHDFTNKVSCMFADLPVHLADPMDRLRHVHDELAAAKAHHEAEAGAALVGLAELEPFGLLSPLLRNAFRVPQRSLVTVTTNVPGPREPLFLMGRRMLRMLPYVPIADRIRIGLAILSYCDEVAFGVTADFATGRDVHVLVDGIRDDLDALQTTVSSRVVVL